MCINLLSRESLFWCQVTYTKQLWHVVLIPHRIMFRKVLHVSLIKPGNIVDHVLAEGSAVSSNKSRLECILKLSISAMNQNRFIAVMQSISSSHDSGCYFNSITMGHHRRLDGWLFLEGRHIKRYGRY